MKKVVLLWMLIFGFLGPVAQARWFFERKEVSPPVEVAVPMVLEPGIAKVVAPMTGRLYHISVEEADQVSPGTIVASYDARVLRAQIESAEALLQQRKQQVKVLRAQHLQTQKEAEVVALELQRTRDLRKRFSVTQEQLDREIAHYEVAQAKVAEAWAQVEAALAGVTQAGKDVQALQAELSFYVVPAGVPGRVVLRLAKEGVTVAKGDTLMLLEDRSTLWVSAWVPAEAWSRIGPDTRFLVKLDDLEHTTLSAEIVPEPSWERADYPLIEEHDGVLTVSHRLRLRLLPPIQQAQLAKLPAAAQGRLFIRFDAQATRPDLLEE